MESAETPLLSLLRAHAPAFGPELARLAAERGLAVTRQDGSTQPIPVTATPVVRDGQQLRRRAALSAHISSATFKLSRAVLAGPNRELLLGALSPLERQLAEATFHRATQLVTVRVDYFEQGTQPFALEVNATIPAMQGYSDIAAHTFLEVVGRYAGLPARQISVLQARNGSNAAALYRALLDGFARERAGRSPQRIALLCRRHDAQITEQRHLAARFTELGTEAHVVHPDELSGDRVITAGGRTFDLIYRHLFVRRLEETPAPWVSELLSQVPSPRVVVLNPPASQVEVKTSFAMLSRALAEPELARAADLSEEELAAARAAVPWTRPFRAGPSHDPDGQSVPDLVARVAAEPSRFVLKRAWDYGGRAVFVGKTAGEPGFVERVVAAYGAPLPWPELCARAAVDPAGGGFVVQELVEATPQSHLLCTDEGVKEVELFVDFSAYASVGLDHAPAWGGVCRGSPSRIVNIVGGGGVLPLLTSDVAEALHKALLSRQD
jgi:hypothetical protein